jgi:hypothetical protein
MAPGSKAGDRTMNLEAALFTLLSPVAILIGIYVVFSAVYSAIRTFVLPRSAPDPIIRFVFRRMRALFDIRLKKVTTYEQMDAVLALYAPVTLVFLPVIWLAIVMTGYALIYWGLQVHPETVVPFTLEAVAYALRLSGSSVLTLGIVSVEGFGLSLLMFSEAAIGLILVALLIAYLPTMYSAFSRREELVAMLEVRAGSPVSFVELFRRVFTYSGPEYFWTLWTDWEVWFTQLEESHTSLPALTFFRSQQPTRSWITAAGTILDAASLYLSTLDIEKPGQAAMTLRAGLLALRRICDFFGFDYDPDPKPDDPISISRDEFDDVCEQLVALNIPLKADRDQAWKDFAGWRVNYDTTLIALCGLVLAPYAMWSSDRGIRLQRPRLFRPLRLRGWSMFRQRLVRQPPASGD